LSPTARQNLPCGGYEAQRVSEVPRIGGHDSPSEERIA
jgi:hypothetical protein